MRGYQLKITIKGSKPPIWRRVIVPEKITFSDLDKIIEYIFGWTHSHLYEFYIPGEDLRITCDYDEFADIDDHTDMDESIGTDYPIDEWMQEKEKFMYVYDFGDWWEHQILVEKVLSYENRYPQVIKFKGPEMIEDCGGIWSFYDYIDEACPFDMEAANGYLKDHMSFQEAAAVSKRPVSQIDLKKQYEKLLHNLEVLDKLQNYTGKDEDVSTQEVMLADIFSDYSKENLHMIARIHGLVGYSRFSKKDLVQWLKNSLLETVHMKKMIMECSREELEIFEEAMDHVYYIDEEFVSTSLLLCSYCGYTDREYLIVPKDVREKYKKICTKEMKRVLEQKWTIEDYCESAVYLYGVISMEELTKIYNKYEEESLDQEQMTELCRQYVDTGSVDFVLMDNTWLMDEDLSEENLYKILLNSQGSMPYFIPKTKEEFLSYGELYRQEPNEKTERFMDFLMNRMHLEFTDAISSFYLVQDLIRYNYPVDKIVENLAESGRRVSGKIKKDLEKEINSMGRYTRCWETRGFTQDELEPSKGGTQGKVIPFAKKVYPNDPCPCGSGKKYKYCCGKND